MAKRKQDPEERSIAGARKGLDGRHVEYDGDPPDDDTPTGEKVKNEWQRLQKFETSLKARERKAELAEQSNSTTTERLDRGKQAHEDAVEDFHRQKVDHDEAVTRFREELDQHNQRELELTRREAEAEAGFRELQRETLEALRSERTGLQQRLDDMHRELAEYGEDVRARARENADAIILAATEEADIQRQRANTEIARTRQSLEEDVAEAERRARELIARERQVEERHELLQVERELLDERRGALAEMVEQRVAVELREAKAALEATERERDRVSARLYEVEVTLRSTGSDPVALVERVDELTRENDRLESELRTRPEAPRLAELEEKAREAAVLRVDVMELERQLAQNDNQLRRQGIAVAELEVLRDERDALRTQKGMLKSALDELRAQFDDLNEREATPFPACSDIDASSEHGLPANTVTAPALDELAERIQGSMATEERFYTSLDTQLFLAGLATTRLHLLQGHSGTGKTTLPVEFARALGGRAELIEVQAGWRDQDDLFGYYNAFEGRFYESTFTRELYLAQSPQYRDVPVFIVLDEMNLAHPEQYFSTLLSQLENPKGERSIPLVPRRLAGAPERFLDGRSIKWPDNVWFIGTANQDETTVAFADKTIDRSHVHELPISFEPFKINSYIEDQPISFTSLVERFGAATERHAAAGERAVATLRSKLAPIMNKLDASWSNRVDKQLRVFVPVAIAAGASQGDAVDHVFSTKILRKVMNRHDLQEGHLDRVAERVASTWAAFTGGRPTKSLTMLADEGRRLGGHLDLDEP